MVGGPTTLGPPHLSFLKKTKSRCSSTAHPTPPHPPPPVLALPRSCHQRQPSTRKEPLDHISPRREKSASTRSNGWQKSQRHRTCLIHLHISRATNNARQSQVFSDFGCTEIGLLFFPLPTSPSGSVIRIVDFLWNYQKNILFIMPST